MADVTRVLSEISAGDPRATDELLPLVYGELRRLAAARMANERVEHTIGATGLVHEAYLRLVGSDTDVKWDGRGHFFAAAAEAMRRILVDHARKVGRQKRGGDRQRISIAGAEPFDEYDPDDVIALHEVLDELSEEDPELAKLVKMRVFAGLSNSEAASMIGMPPSTAKKHWLYAKAWLRRRMQS